MHLFSPYRYYILCLCMLPLAIEGIGIAAYRSGILSGPGYPDYSINESAFQNYHADLDSTVGNWRPSKLSTRSIKECFDVEMQSNNYGARDDDWDLENYPNGIVLLGDSFLEGQGLDMNQTVASLLEQETGKQVFNLATAGHFGPTQYRLIAEKFRGRLNPSLILVGLNLPNDIIDESGNSVTYRGRYRPYLKGTYPNYTVDYRGQSLEKSRFTPNKSVKRLAKTYAEHYSLLYHLYLKVTDVAASLSHPEYRAEGEFTAQSFVFSDLERIRYNLSELKRSYGVPVVVFTVPNRFYATGDHSTEELREIYDYFDQAFKVDSVDFIVSEKLDSFNADDFHRCDPHWNARGNIKMTNLIVRELEDKGYLSSSYQAAKAE